MDIVVELDRASRSRLASARVLGHTVISKDAHLHQSVRRCP